MIQEQKWKIELLGPLSASLGSYEITKFRTHKTSLLLAYLAMNKSKAFQREELIQLIWTDVDLDSGRNALRVAIGHSVGPNIIVSYLSYYLIRMSTSVGTGVRDIFSGQYRICLQDIRFRRTYVSSLFKQPHRDSRPDNARYTSSNTIQVSNAWRASCEIAFSFWTSAFSRLSNE